MKLLLCVLMTTIILCNHAAAQHFEKGDSVEIDITTDTVGNGYWRKGQVVELRLDGKAYIVNAVDGKAYTIPYRSPERWIRVPLDEYRKPLTIVTNDTTNDCVPTHGIVRQLIREEIAKNFPDFDSIKIKYRLIRQQEPYKNTSEVFGKMNTIVFPYLTEFTVDMVSGKKAEVKEHKQLTYNRNYIFYQNPNGICELHLDKENAVGDSKENKTVKGTTSDE